jgi:hypothetical protein
MRTKFQTETGSVYIVDADAMAWERLSTGPESGHVRTKVGALTHVPAIIVGESVALMGPPFVEGAVARAIITSRVVEILPCE